MTAPATGTAPVPVQPPGRLTRRADYLRAARGRRTALPGFVLQGWDRRDDTQEIRAGFTCSRKVGNAVARNRAKRRLRELARLDLVRLGRPGWDYVLIGRHGTTATLPFETLRADLARGLAKLHAA